MIRLALVVGEGWQRGTSGVTTFLRTVHDAWVREMDCAVIELPAPPRDSSGHRPSGLGRGHGESRGVAGGRLRLAAGYARELWRDIRRMTLFKDRFKGRTIVVNQFGCEVLPLALRLAFPRRRIIAIAHTHPGSGAAARCVVRSIVERLCYASVSDIVYSSRSVKEGWTRRFGQAELKGRVILHGIAAPDRAVPDDYPDKPVGTVDFLCAAQFLPMKGQAVLLEAWERALASGLVNARLIFVGDGACFEEVRQSAMRRNLLSSVHFLGARPDGARYFNGADVGVLMSTEAEAFGLVLLEAMSRGKPVLASRSGGIPEVVVHGETGLLVDPSQPEEVAQAVRRLASSAEERARMGGNGHGRWQELFCVERMLREYREYFEAE